VTVRTYFTPESLEEALALKASYGHDLHVIAGGTLIMPQINEGLFFPELVMGLRNAGMDAVRLNGQAEPTGIGVIGAAVTLSQMEKQSHFPILQEAAHSIGGWAVRNMATVAGNMFNRPPYGDFCVALLVLGAQIKIQSASAERMVDLNAFLTGGRQLAANELITKVHIPGQSGKTAFRKFGPRQGSAATIVSVAAQIDVADGAITSARIALGGADTTARRFPEAELVLANSSLDDAEALAEQAAMAAAQASNPITNPVASEWYRRRMIEVQLKRLLSELLGST
jgi:aerobic carbon-monoxide dehydrogenase medium subunit